MSLGKVFLRTSFDLGLALAIGAVIGLPFVLFGPKAHQDRYTFSALPGDDHALEQWFREQSGVRDVVIARKQGILEVNYRSGSRFTPINPPWMDLGYTSLRSATFFTEFMPVNSKSFFILVLSGQVGFLSVGLWRIRKAIRSGESIPRLLGGQSRPAVLWGVMVGIGLVGFGFLYDLALQALFGPSALSSDIWTILRDFPPSGQALLLVAGVIMAPISEEIFFRGAFFGSFVAAGHMRAGTVISAVTFSLVHFSIANTVAIVVLGLVLVWIYRRTGSILAPITAHAINNAVVLGLIVSGHA